MSETVTSETVTSETGTNRRERAQVGSFGSLEVPVDSNFTVETRLGAPLVFRYLFGFTVVAVTGGPSLNDLEAAVRDTYARYDRDDAKWVDSGASDSADGATRRYQREFTWIENDYLPMISVVACLSNDNNSLIIHGSCATGAGDTELATLRSVVASARLP